MSAPFSDEMKQTSGGGIHDHVKGVKTCDQPVKTNNIVSTADEIPCEMRSLADVVNSCCDGYQL